MGVKTFLKKYVFEDNCKRFTLNYEQSLEEQIKRFLVKNNAYRFSFNINGDHLRAWTYRRKSSGYIQDMHRRNEFVFDEINIETINRCNGTCSFCYANKNNDPRKYEQMDEKVFFSIIKQLKDIAFRGQVGLFLFNEPLLDKRIIDWYKYTREQLPDAWLGMHTNGILLTHDIYKSLIPLLNGLIIDCYAEIDAARCRFKNKIEEIWDFVVNDHENRSNITMHLINVNAKREAQGGDSPNNCVKYTVNASCVLPFSQMVIRPNGDVNLCCQDASGRMKLGNVVQNPIMEIWLGERYKEVRNAISLGRKKVKACLYCHSYYREEIKFSLK